MKIEVKRIKLWETGNNKASVDITLGGLITINGCSVVQGKENLFVSMPQRKGKDEKYYSIVWIEDKALKQQITDAVLAKYNEQTAPVTNNPDNAGTPDQIVWSD